MTTYRQRLSQVIGPKPLPILGNMHQIKRGQFHISLETWAKEYGSCYQLLIGSKRWLVISDPNMYQGLLRDRPEAFARLSSSVRGAEEIGVRGVFIAEDEEWRQQRKLVMRALNPDVVKRFFPQLKKMTERLQQRWRRQLENGQQPELLRDLKAFTLDITLALAFGQDINTLEHPENPLQRDIECIFKRMAKRMTSPIKYWRYLRLPADRASDAAAARIAQAIAGFISQTRELLKKEPERRQKPGNLMEALLVARDEPGSEFTDSHVSGNAITMVFAGEDTTSNSIAWLIAALAQHPSSCQRIHQEVAALCGQETVLPEYAMLQQLPWLEAALQESMRLTPVVPFMGVESKREMIVNDILLPADTPIILLLRQAGMQEDIFPQAKQFLPQRWFGEHGQEHELTRKLFSFGGGPRLCPGRYLALVEIKMLAAMLMKNFELLPQAGTKIEEVFTFTMTPNCLPVHLKLHT